MSWVFIPPPREGLFVINVMPFPLGLWMVFVCHEKQFLAGVSRGSTHWEANDKSIRTLNLRFYTYPTYKQEVRRSLFSLHHKLFDRDRDHLTVTIPPISSVSRSSPIWWRHYNNELYLHDYNNTALQKSGKHENYSNY